MTRYIAEDVPEGARRPLTDEDAALSAPVRATHSTEQAARHALALSLMMSTHGMRAARQRIFYAAADAISAGVDAVTIGHRTYRIRTEEDGQS